MPSTSFTTLNVIWALLIAATGVAWLLGTEQIPFLPGTRYATVGLFVVAMIKVRLVIRYFMEVRAAPLPLRLLCDAWVIGIGCTMVGIYLFL